MKAFVEQLNTAGYAIIRGFLSAAETADISSEVDRIYAQGLQHHATYRDRNLLFEILDDPKARRRVATARISVSSPPIDISGTAALAGSRTTNFSATARMTPGNPTIAQAARQP